jgi:hypothetical protein
MREELRFYPTFFPTVHCQKCITLKLIFYSEYGIHITHELHTIYFELLWKAAAQLPIIQQEQGEILLSRGVKHHHSWRNPSVSLPACYSLWAAASGEEFRQPCTVAPGE